MEITEAKFTLLTAAEGKILTDGSIYANAVALPYPEAASRWKEVDAPENEAERPVAPATYSKYRLHNALASVGIWDAVWAQIEAAGLVQYWNDCNELSEGDGLFLAALDTINALVESGEIALPEETSVATLLAAARN